MIIRGHEDDLLSLADVATVEDDYEEPIRNSLYYNSEKSLGIAIAASSGSDIVKVGRQVSKRLAELKDQYFPAEIDYHEIFNQSERVTDSLQDFLLNLLISVLIVVAVLMITMGIRSGIIIGTSLVVTVFGTIMFLGMSGGAMQRVSLASFILAMGMLVDNAIVIVDGILVDLSSGKERRHAMTDIGKQTAMPLLGATLVAIVAFLPVFLSPDTAGVYVRDLFIVLAVSLLLSWILALVHVPLMADKAFKHQSEQTPKQDPFSGKIYKVLRASLRAGLKHKTAVIVVSLILVALSVAGYGYMKQGFFPDMVYDQLYMEYKLPEGTNSSQVEQDLREISERLKQMPEIKNITMSVGGTPARYNLVRSVATPSLSYGELIIDFDSPASLEKNIDKIQSELSVLYPDAYLKLKRYNIMYKNIP